MGKQKMRRATDEEMEEICPGEEVLVDLSQSPQALPDDLRERVDYCQAALADCLGQVSQWYPRIDEWEQERVDQLHNLLKFAWHYRQEIRLLFSMANPGHDASEMAADWHFITDDVFGPRESEVIH
jgi:hypothetical protein